MDCDVERALYWARALLLDAITNALAHVTGTDAHGSFRHWCYMFHGVPDQ
jgi:hypothetical protein